MFWSPNPSPPQLTSPKSLNDFIELEESVRNYIESQGGLARGRQVLFSLCRLGRPFSSKFVKLLASSLEMPRFDLSLLLLLLFFLLLFLLPPACQGWKLSSSSPPPASRSPPACWLCCRTTTMQAWLLCLVDMGRINI